MTQRGCGTVRRFPAGSTVPQLERSPSMMKHPAFWLATLAAVALAGCQQTGTTEKSSTASSTTTASAPSESPSATTGGAMEVQERTLPRGLKESDLKVGNRPTAEAAPTGSLYYTCWPTEGTKFGSSLDRGEPPR